MELIIVPTVGKSTVFQWRVKQGLSLQWQSLDERVSSTIVQVCVFPTINNIAVILIHIYTDRSTFLMVNDFCS